MVSNICQNSEIIIFAPGARLICKVYQGILFHEHWHYQISGAGGLRCKGL